MICFIKIVKVLSPFGLWSVRHAGHRYSNIITCFMMEVKKNVKGK